MLFVNYIVFFILKKRNVLRFFFNYCKCVKKKNGVKFKVVCMVRSK